MRDHIRVLGILNIIMGALTAAIGLIAFIAIGGAAGFIAASLPSITGEDFHNGAVAAPLIATIGLVIAIFFLALGLPSIIGGWGLMHYKPWSRVLMIVVSILQLFHFPLGTALGVYGLWVLLNDEGRRVLETGGLTSVAPGYSASTYTGPSNFGPPPAAPSL